VVVDDIDAVIDALEHFRQGADLAVNSSWPVPHAPVPCPY
jgi:hypothetical protein